MNSNFENYLIEATNSSACEEIEVIQSLWSNYGKISRYKLLDSSINSVVVKCITLKPSIEHPRGWNTNHSHNRKLKSYQVETYWYEKWNQLCPAKCRVPAFIGSFSKAEEQWIIMEDLNPNFPLIKNQISISEVKICLEWLANFHINFMNQKPIGLWEIGTYWHLKTRPDEYEQIEDTELKSKAVEIDQLLNQCKYQTIVHGDAKLANFCFSENNKNVAAVDFQYVGGGCGMKDVAYFLGSCLTSSESDMYQNELLDFYFTELKYAFESSGLDLDFTELEEEWRRMYPIACADFTRFLLGWSPSHYKVNSYNLKLLQSVLSKI